MSKSRDIADSAATINYIDGLTSDAQSQIDTATSDIATNTSDIAANTADIATKAPLSNPTFTGTVTADGLQVGSGTAVRAIETFNSVPSWRLNDTDVSGLYHEFVGTAAGTASLRIDHANVDSNSDFDISVDGAVVAVFDSTGIDVTGTVTATAFSGDGSGLTGVDSLPSQTGNAGEFLTTDGTNPSWVEISASPTLQATASGSIANGDAVIVNSDGTVSAVVETTGAASLGGEVSLTSANTTSNVSAYHADQKSVVVFYVDADNSNYLTAVVGSALGGVISWSTPQVVFSAAIGNLYKAVYHATEKVIVLTYFRQSNTTVRLKAFSLAAGSLSGGNEASANGGSRPTLTYDSSSELIICAYRQINAPYYGEALTLSVSGTTLTTNTITVISSVFSEYTGLSYDPVQNKTLYVYGELSTGKSEARILTVSGTNISSGSAVQNWMGSGNYPQESVALIYDPQTDQHIAFMKASSSGNNGVSVALAISGSSITFGSLYEFESNQMAFVRAAYVPAANKFVVGYTLNTGNDLYGIIASVSGTVISFTGKQLLRTSIATNFELDVASFDFLKTAVITYDEASSGEFARTYSPVTFNSNLTTGNYIGISDAAYTGGATATVQIVGSVDDAQSGLSAGQAYYVQSNGTFGNSPDIVSVFGGTAVSATKLIVKG